MHPPIIQVVGYKNSGKTTFLCRLIEELRVLGYKVGSVKHDAHDFDMDHEGRDSWKLYEAGAEAVAITSSKKSAVIRRTPLSLQELAAAMPEVDLVVAEGFKTEPYPKVVLLRGQEDEELLDLVSGAFASGNSFVEQDKLIRAVIDKVKEILQ